MTQSYLAQGLKQSRFLFELHTREPGKQSCCGNFRTFSLIATQRSLETGPLFLRVTVLCTCGTYLELRVSCALFRSLLDDDLPRKRLFTVNESLLANLVEEIDGDCSIFRPSLEIHEANNPVSVPNVRNRTNRDPLAGYGGL